MKGRYGGELLTTIARDANEQMLPLAYAIVEVENKDSWTWFLELLIDDLGGAELCQSCTFISDQQKVMTQAWEMEMMRIKEVNEDAFKHLIDIPSRYWSRSWFTTTTQSDTLVNNMSKAINSVLVNTRTKPIISMLGDIRLHIMKKWAASRLKIKSYPSSICPKILSRLHKETNLMKYWIPRHVVLLVVY